MPKRTPLSRREFFGATAAGVTVAAGIPVLNAQAQRAVPPPGGPAPDLMLVNGRIHTMDARDTIASTVTIRNGRIAAVGNQSRRTAPAGMQVIDLHGRLVVPGLIESHLHGLELGSRAGYHTSLLENTTTIGEVQEILAEHRKTVPEGQWITSMGGWHPNQWAEHRHPTLKELDEAVPDRPILLYERFTGPAATNTLGKKFFDAADAAPPLHPDYRKVNVSQTGAIGVATYAMGGPAMSALYLLRRMQTAEDKKRNSLVAMAYSTSLGLTSWLDESTLYSLGPLRPTQGLAGLDPYRVYDSWLALNREGRLTIRVQFDFTNFAEPDNQMLEEYLKIQLPFFGDDKFRLGGIGEWAAPIANVPLWTEAQRIVARAGWRNQNSPGDAATLRRLVDTFETVNKEFPIADLRWNVNLLGTSGVGIDTSLLTRLNNLGCSVNMPATNFVTSADPKTVAGPDFRTITEHGIHAGIMSNAAHISPLNPWQHIYYATTGVNSFGSQVNPGQHLTRQEALRRYTATKGWFLRMEDTIGTIEPGKYADLAVLDRDYFAIPDVEIKKIRSVLTIVDGRIVHQAPGLHSA